MLSTERKIVAIACFAVTAFLALAGCVRILKSEQFTYRSPTSINENKLMLNGYYYTGTKRDTAYTGIHPMILWRNGTVAATQTLFPGSKAIWRDSTLVETFEPALENFEEAAPSLEGERSDLLDWGAFRIEGDSINVQVVQNVSPGGRLFTYGVAEYSGIVSNDSTFVITKHSGWNVRGKRRTLQVNWTYHFRPLKNTTLEAKPDPSNWLEDRFD